MSKYIKIPNDGIISVGETKIDLSKYPTEDVAPVIHAEWNDEGNCHRCSNCGAVLEEEFNWHYHQFCYHCGAIMETKI